MRGSPLTVLLSQKDPAKPGGREVVFGMMKRRLLTTLLVMGITALLLPKHGSWAKWYTNESLKHSKRHYTNGKTAHSDHSTDSKPNHVAKKDKRMHWISGVVETIRLPYIHNKSIKQLEKEGTRGIRNQAIIVVKHRKFFASPNIVKVVKSRRTTAKSKASLSSIRKGDKVFMLVKGNRIYRIFVE